MPDLSNPPKVAVIGAGYWGRNLVRDFHLLGALALVCDSDQASLAAAREGRPDLAVTGSFEEALANPGVAAVAVATPAPTHARLALAALSAGKDVFVEKPLALDMADGRAMVELAESRGRILMVDHLLNRHPAVERLKKMALSGELGRVVHVSLVRRNFGILKSEESALWSLAPHDISLALGLMGRPPVTVQAVGGGGWLTPAVKDMATAHLLFDGGAAATIAVSWLHPVKEQRVAVTGLEAMAVFDDTAPWESKLVVYPHRVRWSGAVPKAERAEGRPVELTPGQPLLSQCRLFLECVQSRQKPPDSDGREALSVLQVLTELTKSMEDARPRPFAAAAEAGGDIFVHPTAVIDPGAAIGRGAKIWHFSHVLAGSVLGENVNIGQNVVVGPRAKVGPGCKIQNNVSLYEGVELEADVFCGPSMVFTNVHNPRAFIRRMHELRPTVVRRGASIGANATIVCGHELGRYCFIAAGAVVAANVPAHALMMGVPARQAGWVCRCGARLPETLACPACGLAYEKGPEGLAERPAS
jgi:UDP-2-acetamido-3-amino-2,3-dideoxy-glucuronate N-acetyltransferase